MAYDIWRVHFEAVASRDGGLAARRWNLEMEMRISADVEAFKTLLGARHSDCLDAAGDHGAAAKDSLLGLIEDELKTPGSHWLGRIRIRDPQDVPGEVMTHLHSDDVKRYYNKRARMPRARQRGLRPAERVRFEQPLKIRPDGSRVTRFIWVTFNRPGAQLPDDPRELVQALGLDGWPPDVYVYRVRLRVDPSALFVPTCFDAELRPAWAPPPDHSEPWGLTRHLCDGRPMYPELLSETEDHGTVLPTAELVGARPLGVVEPDYMRGRIP
jgi:hypothetical protein